MLGKLMKYELKSTSRYLIPLYGALLLLALLNRFSAMWLHNSNQGVIDGLLMFFYVMLVISVFAITAVSIILRFYHNLLGREGYLMFTLPVSTAANIFSKLFSSMIWAIASLIMFILSLLLITVTTPEVFSYSDLLISFRNNFGPDTGRAVFLFVETGLICLLSLASGILSIYLSMSIGQLANRQKLLLSVATFIGLQFLINTLGVLFMGLCSANLQNLLNLPLIRSLVNWFMSLSQIASANFIIGVVIVGMLIFCALFYIPCHLLLQKKLNLA